MKKYKNILKNRADGASKLRDIMPLQKLKDEDWMILAVSKGGLVIGDHLRENNKNTLDFLFSEAIMAPNNSECEIARVSEREEIVINENLVAAFEIKYDYVYGEAHRKHEEKILSYIYQYRKGRHLPSLKERVVLLVDEGAETGMKFMTAIKTVLVQKPKAVYIAAPVMPSDVLEQLDQLVDKVFFIYNIDDFVETELYYENLENVDDERIEKILGDKV